MMDDEPERMLLREFNTLKAKLAKVEAERDAFASNIPDAAQNLIRNAHTGRLKALHRAVVAEAALSAVYRLGLEDASRIVSNAGHSLHVEIDYLPTPTAAELMARINEGETDNGMA